MPEITKETKEQKEKNEKISKSTKKLNPKTSKKDSGTEPKTTKKQTASSKKKTNASKKEVSTKSTKKNEKKSESNTKKTTKKVTSEKKAVQKVDKKDEKIKEETVIQKIKNFIAKIIEMQEEAKKEELEKDLDKEEKAIKKTTKKTTKKEQTPYMLEYYDLPYRYNETIVKILAQTPQKLFVYWDISDNDKNKYIKAFGEHFFEETYPVLLVHNQEKDYTFEVAINDFANSWYIDINDPKSTYVIELGRKFKNKPEIINIVSSNENDNIVVYNDYLPIIKSNVLEVPNDHVLFENIQVKVLYRNVKNSEETFVDIENNIYTRNIGHIYNIHDIYKEIYSNEFENEDMIDLLNPSSMSSSTFKQ